MHTGLKQIAEDLSKELGINIIYWDKTISDSDFNGITDDRCDYGYIVLNDSLKEFSPQDVSVEHGCVSYRVSGDYRIVIDIKCKSSLVAAHLLFNNLGCINGVLLKPFSTNAERIYKAETGKDIQQCGKQLVCIPFEYSEMIGGCNQTKISEC